MRAAKDRTMEYIELTSNVENWAGICIAAMQAQKMVIAHPSVLASVLTRLESEISGNKLRGETLELLKKTMKKIQEDSESK